MAKAKDKGEKVNKSQLVREMLQQAPELSVGAIVKAMNDAGHTITPNLVYFVRGKLSGKKARKKRVMKAAKDATPSTYGTVSKTDTISMIRDVKALAVRAGGYEKLKELVDALAE